MTTPETAVRATNLTKTYGEGETEVHALRNVTFEIPRGDFVVLQGASGSGIDPLRLLRGGGSERLRL